MLDFDLQDVETSTMAIEKQTILKRTVVVGVIRESFTFLPVG